MAKKQKYLDVHTATIESLSHDGRGIAHINNKTTFIFGALPKETVSFRYTKFNSQFDEGHICEVQTSAANRVTPQCEFFGTCGGCSLQHLNHDDQVAHKQQVLLERLKHQAHVEPKTVLPPMTDGIWGYRAKARMSVRYVPKKGKVLVGFRERNSRLVANINRCEVLAPSIGHKIEAISELLIQLDAKAHIPQIEIAVADPISALVIRHLQPLSDHDLTLLDQFANEQNYYLYLQPKGYDTVYLRYPNDADPLLKYTIPNHDITIQYAPTQFTQINNSINLKMIDRAIELLDLKATDRVLDLFCGIGNFTLPIARHCQSVIGVEGERNAVDRAKQNAELNQIDNAQFYTCNLFESCEQEPWAQQSFDKILLDPPRSGAKEIMPMILKWQPSRIVYVSCHSATLARDVETLIQQGYTLEKAGMMDMFPHTAHAEAITLLTK